MNRRTAAALDDLAGCITIAIRELGLNDLQHPRCVFRLLEARAELSKALSTEDIKPWPAPAKYYASKWEGDDEYVVVRHGSPPLPGTYSKARAEAEAARLNAEQL